MNKGLWIVTLYEEEDYGRETSELVGVFLDEEKAVDHARKSISEVYPEHEYSVGESNGHNRHVFHFFDEKEGQYEDGFKTTNYVVEYQTIASDIT